MEKAESLNTIFAYDPCTGVLTWRIKLKRNEVGAVLNHKNVRLYGQYYRKTHIIWCMMTGEWPPANLVVDHKNGDDTDNSWANLRLATHQQNQFNKRGYGSFPKGVVHKRDATRKKPYAAVISIDGKKTTIGHYATVEEAAAAYQHFAKLLHGEFYRESMN